MNKTIKKGLIEVHEFNNNDVPIILYPDVKKYKDIPFLINKHIDLELLFVHDGKIEMHLDDAVFFAVPGDVVVANSNVLHNIIPITESVRYDCIIIDRDFCNHYGFGLEKNRVNEILQNKELFVKLERIKGMMRCAGAFRVAEVTAEMLQMLVILFSKYSMPLTDSANYRGRLMLEKGVEFIHDHFKEQIDVEQVAEHAGYSKYHFCRKFKEVTGCTVVTYINMRRISYAKERFSEGAQSITEVAVESGFNNIAYFSQIFRKYVKCTPREYKEKVKKIHR